MASRAHTKRFVRLGLDFRKHQHGIWTAFFLPALLSIRPTSSKKAINPSCHAMQTQSRLTRAPDFFKRDCSRLGGPGTARNSSSRSGSYAFRSVSRCLTWLTAQISSMTTDSRSKTGLCVEKTPVSPFFGGANSSLTPRPTLFTTMLRQTNKKV